ncbi:MAG: S-layer homology domain-containing protein [Oscillospiraceae bacterium]
MKRILSVFLLIAMTVSTFAILPAQAAAPITSTEEDSIVPSPWDSIETEGGAFSSEIEEAGLTYAAQGAETYGARSSSLPFRDVSSSSWFYDEVVYVYEAGLMDGISSTEFAPNASLTRAEVVTVLYRLDGSPAVDGGSAFTDVPDGAFYSKPVAWASQNGIVEGVGNHEFPA